ncbi:hypothetical protein B4U80_02544 [Leptotrombidium deliense]|uniref:Centaurin-gamma-1A-like protein n=1 Tax=Leptotrombidium deliense TaxID=299467 RepID=A0A443SU23_9ACAR|nr:hypothetical protein B4U80_02544 [Leptotrombidium deliense]
MITTDESLICKASRDQRQHNSLAIRQEIQRFESVHPSIYTVYDLLESINDSLLAQQIREHVVCIEGGLFFIIGSIQFGSAFYLCNN